MPSVDYAINGCSSWETTPGTSYWREDIVAVIAHDRVMDGNLKRKIKNRTLYTCRLF